jgi:hypothetical protein
MTDLAQVPAERRAVAIPKPSAIRPGRALPKPALPKPALPKPALPKPALPGAVFPGAALPEPVLPGAVLPGAVLPGAVLPGAVLPGAVQVPVPVQRDCVARPEASRAGARGALAAALAGVHLGCRDRQFLSRLVHWDKRSAASVASLIRRARLAGRAEAALTPRQHEVVMMALRDAAVYRASGADAIGCWDCENCPGSQCADHARDSDRSRGYADLAVQLSGLAREPALEQLAEVTGYRHPTPVAS